MDAMILNAYRPRVSVLGLFGESVFMQVDHFHQPGETIHAHGLYAEPGGKGYNQAVAAQRLGGQVTFYGCGGYDKSCDLCADFLLQEGILQHIEQTHEMPSSYACILTDKHGENRVSVYRGAADAFSVSYLQQFETEIAQSNILLLNYEYPSDVNFAAVEMAQKHGVRVILNPAPPRDMPVEWIKKCWLVTPNEQEAVALLGKSYDGDLCSLAENFMEAGFERVVVTLGSNGALLVENGRAFHYPGLSAHVVDTTGAGDTFNAALAVAIGKGVQLSSSVEFAMNAATLSIGQKYVMPGLPGMQQVMESYRPIVPNVIF